MEDNAAPLDQNTVVLGGHRLAVSTILRNLLAELCRNDPMAFARVRTDSFADADGLHGLKVQRGETVSAGQEAMHQRALHDIETLFAHAQTIAQHQP